jgi:hypothetical protein
MDPNFLNWAVDSQYMILDEASHSCYGYQKFAAKNSHRQKRNRKNSTVGDWKLDSPTLTVKFFRLVMLLFFLCGFFSMKFCYVLADFSRIQYRFSLPRRQAIRGSCSNPNPVAVIPIPSRFGRFRVVFLPKHAPGVPRFGRMNRWALTSACPRCA